MFRCSNLEVLCYSLYEGHHESITDEYIRDLFENNPMDQITTFYCEKSILTELTFFYLAGKLSKLKYAEETARTEKEKGELEIMRLSRELERLQYQVTFRVLSF